MRILFTPVAGGSTPLSYMVPLAWACRTAGHEVRIAAQPTLTPAITGAGLPAVEVGGGYDTLAGIVEARGGPRAAEPPAARWDRSGLARPGTGSSNAGSPGTGSSNAGSPGTGSSGAGSPGAGRDGTGGTDARRAGALRGLRNQAFIPWLKAADVMAPDLLRFAERWQPELVITDPLIFAAPLVTANLDIPLVRSLWGPDLIRQIGYPLQGQPPDGATVRDQWPEPLVELFDRYGAEVRNDYAAWTVDPWPTSLQLPGTPGRIPMRFVPYNGAAAAGEWLLERPSRPRVCVTWGTTTTAVGGDETFVLPRVVDALAPLDIEVVLAVSAADRDRLTQVPGNCRVAVSLPLHLLLPTCDAIVNQAGASTLLTAACHGLPQVFLPQAAECPFNAANFSASGASITLDATEATAESIAGSVTTALTSEAMRAAAHKTRDEIAATPPPSEVARTLENLASA